MGEKALNIQTDVIDKLCPNILPLMYTFLMFWMLNKKYKPITLILTTIGIGLVVRIIFIKFKKGCYYEKINCFRNNTMFTCLKC